MEAGPGTIQQEFDRTLCKGFGERLTPSWFARDGWAERNPLEWVCKVGIEVRKSRGWTCHCSPLFIVCVCEHDVNMAKMHYRSLRDSQPRCEQLLHLWFSRDNNAVPTGELAIS